MPSLGESAHPNQKLIEAALAFYAERVRQTPEPFKELAAGLVIVAYGLAGQDWHRLEIIDRRTIMVHNKPVW